MDFTISASALHFQEFIEVQKKKLFTVSGNMPSDLLHL